ncbi:aluminum-activated malate transporter 12-like [Typha latifolia]|uniref:aluminum-activated malate transporter 12-like n=1 Tax=Typha latifolia TaxID=4733 RepID=UPI003C2CB505
MDSKTSTPLETFQHSVLIDFGEAMRPKAQLGKLKEFGCSLLPQQLVGIDIRWVIHGVKIGLALVLVSLLYMLESVHDRLGDNAMWAVMTVVVVFEYTAGATISKGINRGIGTILGGGLGSLVALLAQEIGGIGKALLISTSLFFISIPASYLRMVPNFKKKYDYGALIFILTFSLIANSGIRGDEIIKITCDRLSSICMGFVICIFISLFVFPNWAGDELHASLATKFDHLACSIEGICS